MAPEVFGGRECNEKADAWAFGVILYELVVGKDKFPFPATTKSELIYKVN